MPRLCPFPVMVMSGFVGAGFTPPGVNTITLAPLAAQFEPYPRAYGFTPPAVNTTNIAPSAAQTLHIVVGAGFTPPGVNTITLSRHTTLCPHANSPIRDHSARRRSTTHSVP
jgi:hypothetical protein